MTLWPSPRPSTRGSETGQRYWSHIPRLSPSLYTCPLPHRKKNREREPGGFYHDNSSQCMVYIPTGRAIHREELKILQARVSDCVKREEVNHLQHCRPHYMAYWQSFRKYRSEGANNRVP